LISMLTVTGVGVLQSSIVRGRPIYSLADRRKHIYMVHILRSGRHMRNTEV